MAELGGGGLTLASTKCVWRLKCQLQPTSHLEGICREVEAPERRPEGTRGQDRVALVYVYSLDRQITDDDTAPSRSFHRAFLQLLGINSTTGHSPGVSQWAVNILRSDIAKPFFHLGTYLIRHILLHSECFILILVGLTDSGNSGTSKI